MAAVATPPPYGQAADWAARGELYVVDRTTRQSPWFLARALSDAEAADLLQGAPDGCFIVRASRIPNDFILSYSYNGFIHHWLLVASPFGVTLKRSEVFFGNIYELVSYYSNIVPGSPLPCRLSLHRTQQFFASGGPPNTGTTNRASTTTRNYTSTRRVIHQRPPPPPPPRPVPLVRVPRRREYIEEFRPPPPPPPRRVVHRHRRVQKAPRSRTLLTFDVVPEEEPLVVPQRSAEERENAGRRHYERRVEETAGGEPVVHEVTTIEREYDLADDVTDDYGDDGSDSYTSYSSYCYECEQDRLHGHRRVVSQVVVPATTVSVPAVTVHRSHGGAVDASSTLERARDVTVEREKTIRTRREVNGVPVGEPDTQVFRYVDHYVEENGQLVLKTSEQLPAGASAFASAAARDAAREVHVAGGGGNALNDSANAMSTPLRPARDDSRYERSMYREEESRTTQQQQQRVGGGGGYSERVADYSTIPAVSASLSDARSRSLAEDTHRSRRLDERYAAGASTYPLQSTRVEQQAEAAMEDLSIDKQRRVTRRTVVDGREVEPPTVTTTHHFEHYTRGPNGELVRDQVRDDDDGRGDGDDGDGGAQVDAPAAPQARRGSRR